MGMRARITDEQVLEALRRIDLGVANTRKAIARDLGCSIELLSYMCSGKGERFARLRRQYEASKRAAARTNGDSQAVQP